MSNESDHPVSAVIDKNQPSTARGKVLKYSGNRSHIPGLLKAHSKWCTRTGKYIHYAKYHGVLYKNLLAVDSANAAYSLHPPIKKTGFFGLAVVS